PISFVYFISRPKSNNFLNDFDGFSPYANHKTILSGITVCLNRLIIDSGAIWLILWPYVVRLITTFGIGEPFIFFTPTNALSIASWFDLIRSLRCLSLL